MATSSQFIKTMILALFCTASTQAQEPEDVIKFNTNLVTVNVAVTGDKGRPLRGLRREDFLLTEEGKPMRVEFFDNYGPASIVFVVDLSSSMKGTKWQKLKTGMKQFLAKANSGNDYTLIGFSDRTRIVARSINDDELRQVMNSLAPDGDTALYDAVLLGLNVLAEIPQRHKALVVFSDGEDNCSRAVLATVKREVLTRHATIYTVGILLDGNAYHSPGERTGRELLNELATATGGSAHFPTSGEIERVLKQIRAEMTDQYSLSYYPPANSPGRRSVQVSIPEGQHSFKLRYQRYFVVK